MFKVGDRVKLKNFPSYTGTISSREGAGYNIKFDDPNLHRELWYNQKDICRETTTMDNPFIETVTVKRGKSGYYDGELIGYADVSLTFGESGRGIDLVVGSVMDHATACYFTKKTLSNLLKILQEVHDLMED